MLKHRGIAFLVAGLVITVTGASMLVACGSSKPTLSASVSDGARDVPLTANLRVKAQGATLQQAVLERIEPPGEPLELSLAEAEARLIGKLAPNARYHLVATAQTQDTTPLPWQTGAMRTISLERDFSTVRAPALVEPAAPLMALPGRPIELRFSEPIARAKVQAPDHPADAQIAREDPRVLRVALKDPLPGEEMIIRLLEVVGVNGASAEELRVPVHSPDPVALASVNDLAVNDRVQIPPDRPLTIQWTRTVTSFGYAVDGVSKKWSGEPNHTIRLPVYSVPGRTIEVAINEATAADGGWLPTPQWFELVSPAPLRIVATWPENGATNISVTGDPTIRFSEPIALADQETAEAAITFDPPVAGRFQWLTQDRVRFLPEDSFPRLTDLTMTVQAGSDGVRAESGGIMEETYSVTFQTGRKKTIDVSLGRQVLTLYEDDEPVWTTLVATGVRGADTPPGTYQVIAKMPLARFRGVNPDGSRYDIRDVKWVLAFYGDYTIHGAYWRSVFGRPGSNGCISMTDANAKVVYDWADEGTTVVIQR